VIFEFENKGHVIERDYRPGRAPQSVRVDGKRYRRVISAPTLMFGDKVGGRNVSFVDISIDPDDYRFHKGSFAKDNNGNYGPAFKSKRDIDAFRTAAHKEGRLYEYGTRGG
jgi:hypothetical protein